MKKLIMTILIIVAPVLLYAQRQMIWDGDADDLEINTNGSINVEVDAERTDLNVNQTRTTSGLTLYMSGNDGVVTDVISVYITGGSTTSAASVQVFTSSVSFTTVGGLYPGTTYWDFSDSSQDTLAEALNYWNTSSTKSAGIEGGIVLSTEASYHGVILSTALTVADSVSCLGSGNAKTLSATPATTPTASYAVYASSMALITTNGLYPGTTHYVFSDTDKDTLTELLVVLGNRPSYTPGIDGTITAARVQGSYGGNDTTQLTEVAATSCKAVASIATLGFDNITGMSYILPASSLSSGEKYYITDFITKATFATGTTTAQAYDGIGTSTPITGAYTVGTTAISDEFYINRYVYNSADTAMRWDVISSTWVTGSTSYIDIRGFRK